MKNYTAPTNADRHTTIEYRKDKTPTPVSAYQVTGLALEICKLPPEANFDAAMEKAFRLLTHYNAKLAAMQESAE